MVREGGPLERKDGLVPEIPWGVQRETGIVDPLAVDCVGQIAVVVGSPAHIPLV